MFNKISSTIQYADWVRRCPRFRRLDLYDRLLDGTFYAHLRYAFYDETDQAGSIIPLIERRPSAQFRLPRMVARWCARKMFAGRHKPKVRHPDVEKARAINKLLRRGKFFQTMGEAVLRGSVGAVAVTFRVDGDGDDLKLAFTVWRARDCDPSFDEMGELSQLRVRYLATGASLKAMAAPGDIKADELYWFVRDFLRDKEITYAPVKRDDWNPVDGFAKPNMSFRDWQTFDHNLEFVPGHWFVNLPGADKPDGCATFEDAIPNSIEIDYTLSQIGRGVRYNCAPQLVVKGNILNANVVRGPMQYLHLQGDQKDEDGNVIGGANAELLEMGGQGTEAALKVVDELRKMALEQIAASRKDPDKLKGTLSGRAMEYLEEDSNDLVMDLRTQYGEHGALILIKKVMIACDMLDEVGGVNLQWPRLYQPSPDEVSSLVTALIAAVDPLSRAAPATPGKPASGDGGTAVPAQPAQSPKPEEQLLTIEEARLILTQALDLTMLDGADEEDEEDVDSDESPTPPGEPTPTAPEPAPVDLVPQPLETPPGASPNTGEQQGAAMMRLVGGDVRINV